MHFFSTDDTLKILEEKKYENKTFKYEEFKQNIFGKLPKLK